jgi:hypothetical protein
MLKNQSPTTLDFAIIFNVSTRVLSQRQQMEMQTGLRGEADLHLDQGFLQ